MKLTSTFLAMPGYQGQSYLNPLSHCYILCPLMWQRNFKEDQSSLELTLFSCKRPCIDFINNLTHIRADYLELNFYVINICRPIFGTIYCFLLRTIFYSMCHKNSTILLMQKLPLVVHTMLVKLTPIHTSRDAVKMQHFKKLHFLLRKNCTN